MVRMSFCVKCGNSGKDLDGNICECQFNKEEFIREVTCLDVPENYRGIIFNTFLVPKDIDESYGRYLDKLHNDITSLTMRSKNVCICAPVKHGKSIFAYSVIERLFRRGIPVFPIFDVLEIKRMFLDIDLCRKPYYETDNPEFLLDSPYLFVKIPRLPAIEVYDTISVIVDRRVRRGNSTIFLYDGTWKQLLYGDKFRILESLEGDGNYKSIEVKSWSNYVEKEKESFVETNIG